MSLWIGIAVAALLLLVGLAGLATGLFIVWQQLRRRQVNQQHRSRKVAELQQLPHRSTQLIRSSDRPTMPLLHAPPAAGAARGPTLAPDDEEQEVPTGVFRASEFKDIESLMKEADKYVEQKKKK